MPSNLRKDDPVYYKYTINNLIKQAKENNLKVSSEISYTKDYVCIKFEADNGEIASFKVPLA